MGIYIKGMEMPTSCDECFLPLQYCPYAMKPGGACPLVPVPKHGRLGDLDELLSKDRHIYDGDIAIGKWDYINIEEVMNAPTIIPADPAEEGEA